MGATARGERGPPFGAQGDARQVGTAVALGRPLPISPSCPTPIGGSPCREDGEGPAPLLQGFGSSWTVFLGSSGARRKGSLT